MILHECSWIIEFIKQVGESDKMQGLQRISSLFHNKFNKLLIQSMNVRFYLSHDIKLLTNHIFGVKK